ncbi:LysM peptidoglycan-binding domain-containing protein [Flavobacterium gilvum]|uniref:Peptidoglycan-binding protein n=1 Tax=Flavobacterium gilvum TaxID=1492737 RepID=A0AAC9N6Z9_9FLAO|nr:LysM peptidoglycan-binding domain-containing protein [Flavobacterium gilvum]AOW09643.1 peptidoglycan-binding protein [Flavobacterium gilvum]KFC58013.1 peptidoglycan-binding protein [Flavobacterium gilvum]
MNYFSAVLCTVLFSVSSSFSQEKIDKYIVAKGETVAQIAQKFKITPYEIYKLNPDVQNGLKPNAVLLIPKSNVSSVKTNAAPPVKTTPSPSKSVAQSPKTHLVLAKETLFGIEKKYDVSDEALKKANPDLVKNGLQIGQLLNIPSQSDVKQSVLVKNNVPVYHIVQPKETKYSIAKKYDITIEELEQKNPDIVANLEIGYELLIKGNRPKPVAQSVPVKASVTTEKKSVVKVSEPIHYIDYTVKPKETFYSLSKMFGLTQQQLVELNPILSSGVQEGMVLKVPSKSNQIAVNSAKQKVVLTKKYSQDKKTLVLLFPFNLAKNSGDTITSTVNRLNNDKFLNMTLDFYSGALMAIDSAKTVGVNIDVKIFDSNETKTTSNIGSIFNDNNLADVDAVVGPFYQNNVEKAAVLFAKNNVPVISPLSKDAGNPIPNLYQSIVPPSVLKTAMFDFLNAKQGNLVAVIDKKRESIRKYISENQTAVKIAPLTETGGLDVENLKKLLVKDRMNYVILESANTGMVKYTINTMLWAMANGYQVQLVILEPNDTLDTDEVSFANLTKLHLMYPSATRENNSPEAQIFMQNYRKKNKVNPSSYAIRGFDITFDTMMRLSQDKTYQETAETMITEQVENKFEYHKNQDEGYANKGVYILYYDTDLTIKEAK